MDPEGSRVDDYLLRERRVLIALSIYGAFQLAMELLFILPLVWSLIFLALLLLMMIIIKSVYSSSSSQSQVPRIPVPVRPIPASDLIRPVKWFGVWVLLLAGCWFQNPETTMVLFLLSIAVLYMYYGFLFCRSLVVPGLPRRRLTTSELVRPVKWICVLVLVLPAYWSRFPNAVVICFKLSIAFLYIYYVRLVARTRISRT